MDEQEAASRRSDKNCALKSVNKYDVRFQLESAADANILCQKYAKKH